jgi:hypothetical protein
MENDPIAHVDLIVENYLKKKLAETCLTVKEYMEGIKTPEDWEEMKDAIKEANSYISFTSGKNTELFEKYQYHLFIGGGGVYMAQGTEVPGLRGRDERE